MNRRSRHLVVLTVAVVTAAIASFAVYRSLLSRTDAAERAPLFVVVAAHSMPIGTELTERDVKRLAWPAGNAVPGSISDIKSAVGRGLLTAVLENEPITVNKLAAMGAAGLPPAIPPGMRAMSVKVNDVSGVAGFVVPGTRVDVLVTIRRQTDSVTRTAAENVQVLTAGTRQDQGKPETTARTANASTVVALLVSPADSERIALAQSEGEIMLTLRNPNDNEAIATTGVRTAALLGGAEPTPAATPAPAPAVKRPSRREPPPAPPAPVVDAKPVDKKIEHIRGMKRTEDVIKDDTTKVDVSKTEVIK